MCLQYTGYTYKPQLGSEAGHTVSISAYYSREILSYILHIRKIIIKYIIPSVIPHIQQKVHFDKNFLSKPSAPRRSIPLRIRSQTFVRISYRHSITDKQIVLSFSGFHEKRTENVLSLTTGQLLFHSTITTFL